MRRAVHEQGDTAASKQQAGGGEIGKGFQSGLDFLGTFKPKRDTEIASYIGYHYA